MKYLFVVILFVSMNVNARVDSLPQNLLQIANIVPSENNATLQYSNGEWVERPLAQLVLQLKALDLLPVSTVAMTANVSNSTITGARLTELNKTLTQGYYYFKYVINYQSSALTTGVKFGVNFTGNNTAFVANMTYAATGTTASTGAASQISNGATGQIGEIRSTRSESTTSPNLGATVSVNTINADMFCIVEGMITVTSIGVLELWHGSETGNATTVMAGTSLILTKTN